MDNILHLYQQWAFKLLTLLHIQLFPCLQLIWGPEQVIAIDLCLINYYLKYAGKEPIAA